MQQKILMYYYRFQEIYSPEYSVVSIGYAV